MNITYKIIESCLCFVGGLSLLSGCGPALVGGGAGVVDMATQDRGVEGVLSDTEIRSKIDAAWLQKDPKLFTHIGLAVQDGYVLLTGSVLDSKTRAEAVILAWQVKGVKAVYDEIKVGEPHSFENAANDTWISTKVRASLIGANGIHSNNYSVTTFNGDVYLLGIAQNQQELRRAIQIAKSIKGVRNVVTHMQVK
ncbi:MAG: BON domain-containing protein [Proteobacteria bacterium]|nr:BON domain-containing protein [Pseudomonadota bacterium]